MASKATVKWKPWAKNKSDKPSESATSSTASIGPTITSTPRSRANAAEGTIPRRMGEEVAAPAPAGKGLLDLCQDGNQEAVRNYCHSSADLIFQCINSPMDAYGNTPLHLAASQNDLTLSSLLLLKGANVNIPNRSGISPIVVAVRLGHTSLVKIMQKHGGTLPPTEDRARNGFGISNQQVKGQQDDKQLDVPTVRTLGRNKQAQQPQASVAPITRITPPAPTGTIRGNHPFANSSQSTIRTASSNGIDDGEIISQLSAALSTEKITTLEDILPSKLLPVYNAAYLGVDADLIGQLSPEIAGSTDEAGSTALMKAAYRGHVKIIEKLLTLGVPVDASDKHGHTELVWAALNGYAEAVRLLLQVGKANVDGKPASNFHVTDPPPPPTTPSFTPLMAAIYAGHIDIVEILLDNGANIDLRVGPGKGKSALMISAWTRHEPIVKLLIKRGATVDTDVRDWLRRGAMWFKQATADVNAWSGGRLGSTDSLTKSREMLARSGSALSMANLAQAGVRAAPLTQGESDDLVALEGFIDTAIAEAKKEAEAQPVSAGAEEESVPAVKPRRNAGRRRGNTGFRQGLNLEKLIGGNPELVVDLTERLPETGTELDKLYITVFQCIVQLVMAANNNIKHHYILISAKAIHHAGEIVRAIEAIQRSRPTPSATSKPDSQQKADQSALLFRSSLDGKFAELADVINVEMPKQLMVATKIAVGVWPPPHAQAEMIKTAANLARACKTLTDLGNTTGFYPVIDKPLEVNFVPFEDAAAADAPPPAAEPTNLTSGLSYSEYKRQNDLKIIEMMSKRGVDKQDSTSSIPDTNLSDDVDKQFFATLDAQLRMFVASVTEVKRLHKEHLKQEYDNATSKVNERADSLMEEIKSFELLHDFPSDLTLNADDGARLTKVGVSFQNPIYPAPLRPLWRAAFDEVQSASYNLMTQGRLASGFLAPPTAADEMLQAAVPCVRAVKKLVTLTKESTNKIRAIASEDQRKKDAWRKACMQNDHVKQLFQMWESQVMQKGVVGEVVATAEDLKALEDGDEGLSLEIVGGRRVVKGGRLTKLVEQMTSHVGLDTDFMAGFVITHHSFTSSLEMLDALMKRYDITPPYGLTKQKFDVYIQKKVFPIRQRVCQVVKYWMDNHFEEDFSNHQTLLLRMQDFLQRKVVDDRGMQNELLDLLAYRLQHPTRGPLSLLPPTSDNPPPKSIIPKSIPLYDLYTHLTTDERAFFDIDPLEMARQLTLVEFDHFRNVTPVECTDQIWGDKRKKEAAALGIPVWTGAGHATALEEMIKHTNILTSWISTNIVKWDTLKARMSALKYFCQFAVHCRELNNFNGITAVNAAMSTAAVNRLHKTWEAFVDKYGKIHEAYEEVADVVTPKGQYANYRKVLKDLQPPAIPFLGVYLTDLTFIELGNPDFLPDSHFINFEKRRKVYTVVKDIQSFQRTPYNIIPVQGILDFYRNMKMDQLKDADALYDLSLVVEPREESDDEDEA
ncbi:hypothetical protein HK097_006984 [Rhizophlyctis rosea]|uniref:Uncharacterized protein n=1 Tax=Rhizophlyctis rosea TaxID=64517 RepID=A0AAD5X5I7_9FUNG|nr:hypothetical protein HK097_006984 [Rhizophlyctis rosea]